MSRLPSLPSRESFPEEKRADYDAVVDLVERLSSGRVEEDAFASACLNAPGFAAAFWRDKQLVLAIAERGTSFSHRDRIFINIVVAIDSGHFGVLDEHLRWAVERAGVGIDTINALWEGRENDLPNDDQQLVEYIRAVANQTVSDALFSQMSARFGTRGAVEYSIAIAYTRLVNQLMQALDVPSISRQEMQATIGRLGTGTTKASDYNGYENALRDFAENPHLPPWVLDRNLPMYVIRPLPQ